MLILTITAVVMVASGAFVWMIARHWSGRLSAPRIAPATLRAEVQEHPRLSAAVTARFDSTTVAGLALTAAAAVAVLGAVGFGLLLVMVRTNAGFARFDLGAAQFAAHHASPMSTSVLRTLTQFGGAAVLVPIALVVCLLAARRHRLPAVTAFLVLTIGGQFGVVAIVKWVVDRTRPNIDPLTGFSGPSFPSGHATAAAASFAAFALLIGIGRSRRAQSACAALAVGLATGIACTRVFLGVHWLTDVLAGLALGWSWFALCSIAFGGRLLRFGAPAEQLQRATDTEQHNMTGSPPSKVSA